MQHHSRFPKAAAPILLGLVCIWFAASDSARAEEYRVGVYFDEAAQSCVGEIRNYGADVRIHIFAFVPLGSEVNGALLSLDLPPGYLLRERYVPKDVTVKPEDLTAITSTSGVDVSF